jgi:hypothetical protein
MHDNIYLSEGKGNTMEISTYIILGIILSLVGLSVYSTVSFNRKCEKRELEELEKAKREKDKNE